MLELLIGAGVGAATLGAAGLRVLVRRRDARWLAALATPLELRRLGGRPPRFLARVHGRDVELSLDHGRIEIATALEAPLPPGFALARPDHPPASTAGELHAGDPEFDARVRIAADHPAAALRLIGHAEVKAALGDFFSRYQATLEGGRLRLSAAHSPELNELRAALADTARVAELLETAGREEARRLEEAKLQVRASAPIEPAHPHRAPLQPNRERQILLAYARRKKQRDRLVGALMFPGLGITFALCYEPLLDALHLSGKTAMDLFFLGGGMLLSGLFLNALLDRCPACNKFLVSSEEGVVLLSCPRCGARLRDPPGR